MITPFFVDVKLFAYLALRVKRRSHLVRIYPFFRTVSLSLCNPPKQEKVESDESSKNKSFYLLTNSETSKHSQHVWSYPNCCCSCHFLRWKYWILPFSQDWTCSFSFVYETPLSISSQPLEKTKKYSSLPCSNWLHLKIKQESLVLVLSVLILLPLHSAFS